MEVGFRDIKFSLFTRSYAGYYFANFIRQSENSDIYIKRLARTLLFNTLLLRCFVYHKTCQRKFSKIAIAMSKKDEKIRVYLNVEKELITLIQERKDKNSLTSEDYEYALLKPAIERAAGNRLTEIKSDQEFEKNLTELKRIYRRWYYDVACKYGLYPSSTSLQLCNLTSTC